MTSPLGLCLAFKFLQSFFPPIVRQNEYRFCNGCPSIKSVFVPNLINRIHAKINKSTIDHINSCMWEQQPLNFQKCPLASSCVVLQYFVVVVVVDVAVG